MFITSTLEIVIGWVKSKFMCKLPGSNFAVIGAGPLW